MAIRAIAFFWKNLAIVRTVITWIRPDTNIRSQNIRSVIFTSVTIHDFLFWCKIVFFIHTITMRSQSMYSKRLVLPLKTYPHLLSISTSVNIIRKSEKESFDVTMLPKVEGFGGTQYGFPYKCILFYAFGVKLYITTLLIIVLIVFRISTMQMYI